MLTPRDKSPLLEAQSRIELVTLHHTGQRAQHTTDLAIPVPILLPISKTGRRPQKKKNTFRGTSLNKKKTERKRSKKNRKETPWPNPSSPNMTDPTKAHSLWLTQLKLSPYDWPNPSSPPMIDPAQAHPLWLTQPKLTPYDWPNTSSLSLTDPTQAHSLWLTQPKLTLFDGPNPSSPLWLTQRKLTPMADPTQVHPYGWPNLI